ncbi:MAG: DUF411 domain-containing protein [Azoarcus sp.]|jgi:hypothetical protein|nr:DUF411 domain-containing protein [Azoarcus sp.]
MKHVVRLFGVCAVFLSAGFAWADDLPVIDVHKNPNCGCCAAWELHLREAGFTVRGHETQDIAATRARFGMPESMASCHTAKVGDYLIEGHVPGEDIKRLLAEQPPALGLAVPGMPAGSPGMETGEAASYDTLLVGKDGASRIFQHHTTR